MSYEDIDTKKVRILEQATEHLLPKCDPIFWFDILTLTSRAFVGIDGKSTYYSMIKSWCENDRNFGLSGRTLSLFRSIDKGDDGSAMEEADIEKELRKIAEEETEETCFLVEYLNGWLLNPREHTKLIAAIKEIRTDNCFKKDTIQYSRLRRIEKRLKDLSQFAKREKKRAVKRT